MKVSKVSLVWFVLIMMNTSLAYAEAGAKSLFENEGSYAGTAEEESAPSVSSSPSRKSVASSHKSSSSPSQTHVAHTTVSHKPKSTATYAGLQYYVDLQDSSGNLRQVTTNHVFHSGDKIRLKVKSNMEGYLYVLNQGSSGRFNPLYPPRGEGNGFIQAGMTYSIPANGFIRFDDTPGTEKVSIVLSKQPVLGESPSNSYEGQDEEAVPVKTAAYTSCAGSSAGSKDLFNEEDKGGQIDCVRRNYGAGSKDLFAEEDTASAQPASYVAMPAETMDNSKVLTADFNLTHR